MKKEEERIKDEEVIFIKPYEVDSSTSSSTQSSGFINEKINNLLKYMKFVKFPTQTRIFRPPPHYQSLWSREEQDFDFWKDLFSTKAIATYNTETSRNEYPINIFQGRSSYKPYFITINNQGQVIIGPNKKTVTTYVVRELEVLVWFIETWMLNTGYCYKQYLKDIMWRRAKGNDNMIGCTKVVSVSASYSRYSILTFSSCTMTHLPHGLQLDSLCIVHI